VPSLVVIVDIDVSFPMLVWSRHLQRDGRMPQSARGRESINEKRGFPDLFTEIYDD
jgi:hypothetical protein